MNTEYASVQLPDLTDLELAVLVCLVAEQHAVVRIPRGLVDDAQRELAVIAERTFGLRSSFIDFDAKGLDDFSGGLFASQDSDGTKSESSNILIAKDLHLAPRDVQVMALELIRSGRILTSSGIHSTPKPFVIIALIPDTAAGPPFLTPHLNDAIFICHSVPADSTFSTHSRSSSPSSSTNSLAKYETTTSNSLSKYETTSNSLSKYDTAATLSRYQTATTPSRFDATAYLDEPSPSKPKVSQDTIARLKSETELVRTTAEMRRYIHDVPTFLRLHRAVAGGISAMATRHLNLLVRTLAPLHKQSYITPSLIGLAAHKIYAHRIVVTAPEDERSMQWGSEVEAVQSALEGMDAERVVGEVLQSIEAPL